MSGASITVMPTQTTTYTVIVTDGCTTPAASKLLTINIFPTPLANFFSDTTFVCSGGCVLFTDASVIQPGSTNSYLWTFGDGDIYAGNQIQKCFYQAGTFDVSLKVTSANGCSDTISLPDYITVGSVPVANFSYDPENPTDLNPLVNFQDYSTFSDRWLWNFGDESLLSNEQNPSHLFSETGSYCITLYVENESGCADSTIKCLVVESERTIYIPNTFTPNDDNLNNTFKVSANGWDIDFFEFRIFNRWGNQVFKTNDILTGWDGSGNEGGAAIDTYVYHIEIRDKNLKTLILDGHVNLIR